MPDRIVLIDGKNFAYRFAATHQMLQTSGGKNTAILYGCPTGLLGLTKKFPDTPLVWVWDGTGPTWRHKMLSRGKSTFKNTIADSAKVTSLPPYLQMSVNYMKGQAQTKAIVKREEPPVGYKANRPQLQAQFGIPKEELEAQLKEFKGLLRRIGQRQFEVACLEGDDLMGILVTHLVKKKMFDEIYILSNDRDFYQFISGGVHVLRSSVFGYVSARREDIQNEFGVSCEDYTKLRAIIGDPGDNIPHLFHMVGPKTAVKWLQVGLDPSFDTWNKLPAAVRVQFAKNDKHNVKDRWDEVHTNYICCQIVRDSNDELLSEQVRRDLLFVPHLKREDFLADTERKTDANYRWMIDFIVEHEMASLYGERDVLWNLP